MAFETAPQLKAELYAIDAAIRLGLQEGCDIAGVTKGLVKRLKRIFRLQRQLKEAVTPEQLELKEAMGTSLFLWTFLVKWGTLEAEHTEAEVAHLRQVVTLWDARHPSASERPLKVSTPAPVASSSKVPPRSQSPNLAPAPLADPAPRSKSPKIPPAPLADPATRSKSPKIPPAPVAQPKLPRLGLPPRRMPLPSDIAAAGDRPPSRPKPEVLTRRKTDEKLDKLPLTAPVVVRTRRPRATSPAPPVEADRLSRPSGAKVVTMKAQRTTPPTNAAGAANAVPIPVPGADAERPSHPSGTKGVASRVDRTTPQSVAGVTVEADADAALNSGADEVRRHKRQRNDSQGSDTEDSCSTEGDSGAREPEGKKRRVGGTKDSAGERAQRPRPEPIRKDTLNVVVCDRCQKHGLECWEQAGKGKRGACFSCAVVRHKCSITQEVNATLKANKLAAGASPRPPSLGLKAEAESERQDKKGKGRAKPTPTPASSSLPSNSKPTPLPKTADAGKKAAPTTAKPRSAQVEGARTSSRATPTPGKKPAATSTAAKGKKKTPRGKGKNKSTYDVVSSGDENAACRPPIVKREGIFREVKFQDLEDADDAEENDDENPTMYGALEYRVGTLEQDIFDTDEHVDELDREMVKVDGRVRELEEKMDEHCADEDSEQRRFIKELVRLHDTDVEARALLANEVDNLQEELDHLKSILATLGIIKVKDESDAGGSRAPVTVRGAASGSASASPQPPPREASATPESSIPAPATSTPPSTSLTMAPQSVPTPLPPVPVPAPVPPIVLIPSTPQNSQEAAEYAQLALRPPSQESIPLDAGMRIDSEDAGAAPTAPTIELAGPNGIVQEDHAPNAEDHTPNAGDIQAGGGGVTSMDPQDADAVVAADIPLDAGTEGHGLNNPELANAGMNNPPVEDLEGTRNAARIQVEEDAGQRNNEESKSAEGEIEVRDDDAAGQALSKDKDAAAQPGAGLDDAAPHHGVVVDHPGPRLLGQPASEGSQSVPLMPPPAQLMPPHAPIEAAGHLTPPPAIPSRRSPRLQSPQPALPPSPGTKRRRPNDEGEGGRKRARKG